MGLQAIDGTGSVAADQPHPKEDSMNHGPRVSPQAGPAHPVRPTRHTAVRLAGVLLAVVGAVAAGPAAAKNEALVAGIRFSEAVDPSYAYDPSHNCVSLGAGPALGGYIQGSGIATVVGPFRLTSTDCIQTSTPDGDPPFAFSSQSFTLTAANGDAIFASYSGTATPTSSRTPWLLSIQGTVTFTGGTGAYKKVKGGGTLTGIEDVSPLLSVQPARGYLTLTGRINTR